MYPCNECAKVIIQVQQDAASSIVLFHAQNLELSANAFSQDFSFVFQHLMIAAYWSGAAALPFLEIRHLCMLMWPAFQSGITEVIYHRDKSRGSDHTYAASQKLFELAGVKVRKNENTKCSSVCFSIMVVMFHHADGS